MEDEKGPELSYKASRPRACHKAGSRVYHSLLGILFFLMMALTLSSLGVFAARHSKIDDNLHTGDAKCILYTTQRQLEKEKLSSGAGCSFTIWGSAVVALGTSVFMLSYVVRAVYGASVLSCLVCVEMPLLFILMIASLAVSINTTIGLALTCSSFNDHGSSDFITASGPQHTTSFSNILFHRCKNYSVTDKHIKFFEDILISETISWAVTVTFLGVCVLYVILAICYSKMCSGDRDESAQSLLDRPQSRPERKRVDWRARYKLKSSPEAASENSKNNPFLE